MFRVNQCVLFFWEVDVVMTPMPPFFFLVKNRKKSHFFLEIKKKVVSLPVQVEEVRDLNARHRHISRHRTMPTL